MASGQEKLDRETGEDLESPEKRRKKRFKGPGRFDEGKTRGKPWNRETEDVFQSVFGRQTLLTLYKLMNDGHFTELYGEFNSGKEANLFAGKDAAGRFIAVKIYRIEASDFSNMIPYLKGDPRFDSVGPSKREVVYAWTKKEFSNLSKMEEAGVKVPHPIAFRDNVLIFELVLDGDAIAPQLKKAHSGIKDKAGFVKKVLENARKIHKAGFAHADLSEYNILVSGSEPVIIDCGQAVLLAHPSSGAFLRRDCENLADFFTRRMGVKMSPDEVLKGVLSPRGS